MIKTNVFQKHFFLVFFKYFCIFFFFAFLYFCNFFFVFFSIFAEFAGDLMYSFWIPVRPLLNPSPGNNHARKAG